MGDDLFARARSAWIALLGLVTATGLGLVVFISQLGWPLVFSGPLPESPVQGVVHNDTIALLEAVPRTALHAGGPRPRRVVSRTVGSPQPNGERSLGVGTELVVSPQVETPEGDAKPPPEPPASHPVAEPATPPPPPTTVPQATEETNPPSSEVPSSPGSAGNSSPGQSGESHGHSSGQGGPPPWAGGGSGSSSPGGTGHGKPDWAGN